MRKALVNFLATVMPDYCPFNREVKIFGRPLFTIPMLCKLNPLFDEIVEEKLRRKGYLD